MGNLAEFNPDDWDFSEESTTFEKLPDGEYKMFVSESSDVSKGNSSGVKLTFEICDDKDGGKWQGRKIHQWFYLVHEKPIVREIAGKKLAGLCEAIGVANPSDTSELHDFPIVGVVKTKPGQDFPEIRYFKSAKSLDKSTPKSADVPF